MFSRDSWKEILDTIKKNKLRTFLSGFTIAIGIFIFISLYGLGNGLINSFDNFFGNDVTNVFFISRGHTTKPHKGYKSNRLIELRNDDIKDIEEKFEEFISYTTPRISNSSKVKYKNKYNTYSTRAVSPSHKYNEKTIMMKGRYINESDIKNKTKIAVIGRLVKDDLFKTENPIGKYIDIGGILFNVVGVFQDDGGDREERYIYIPYTTKQLLQKNTDKVNEIIIGFKPEIGHSGSLVFEKGLEKFLKSKKDIHPKDETGIRVRDVSDNLQRNQQFAKVLRIIVSFVAIGTIIAGIIGISNIMVFIVKERTKELGIKKALGATPKIVIGSILLESIFITTVSGFIGMILGVILLNSLGDSLEDFFIINPNIDISVGIKATLLLILFGGIAGYLPAKRAANIKPIVALRDE